VRRVAWTLGAVLLAAGCGGGTASAGHTTARADDDMCDVGGQCVRCDDGDRTTPRCQLLLGALGSSRNGASGLAPPTSVVARTTTPLPPMPPPMPPLPAGRTDGAAPTDPALSAAAAEYATLRATPFSLDTAPASADVGVHALIAQIGLASAIGERVRDQCLPLELGPSRVSALLLHADALDFVASGIASATLPLPLDLTGQIARASPDVRAEIRRTWVDRIREALEAQAGPVFCNAVQVYLRVLAIDPTNARATAQLAAYGGDFVASCR
jgi:hypothetical protein